jgi:hypothetical protein
MVKDHPMDAIGFVAVSITDTGQELVAKCWQHV